MVKKDISIAYAEDAVAAVLHNGKWAFYVDHKEIWVLNYESWLQSYVNAGHDPVDPEHSERFGIAIVDQNTAAEFLEHLADRQYSTKELGEYLERKRREEEDDEEPFECYPAFLIDFDSRRAVSWYPEPFYVFEKHVPPEWKGSYYDFLSEIPVELRYWERSKVQGS